MNAKTKFIFWLIAATFLVAIGAGAALKAFQRLDEASELRQHTVTVQDKAERLLFLLMDAETRQRGYLLTNDPSFLLKYSDGQAQTDAALKDLTSLTRIDPAQQHLANLKPLIAAKREQLNHSIALQRKGDAVGALAVVRSGEGKQLMTAIQAEIMSFLALEQDALNRHRESFREQMQGLFLMILVASVMAMLFAILFVYLIYRDTQRRLENLVHLETQHLLTAREASNVLLTQTNTDLRVSEAKLAVTLNSVGDAVLATDAAACVTLLNPVAELLTGWTQAEAIGRPVAEVFKIINQETRAPATIPVLATLEHGTVQGLANHTLLVAKDASERAIADSCAPIRGRDGKVIGAVLVFRDITDEYVVQQALRDSAALIQTVLNTVADGVVTLHARGAVIETVNPATEQMFGYSGEALKTKNFSVLIPELDQDHHDGSLEYYSASDVARASGIGREVMGRRQDGSAFPLEIAVSEMWLGGERYFTAILRDISARKQAEAALLKAGALQSAIFHSANFSSIATDANGVIQIFNVGAERMLGYAAAEVMNKITPADISDPQEVILRAKTLSAELDTPIAPGFEALVFKASRGIEDIYELTYIRKDGSRFPAVVSVTALRDEQDSIIGYLLIGTDNTARKAIEAERLLLDQALRQKNIELQDATALAEKANLAKSDFLSSMSHELRTPLSAILGFTQLIESGTPPPTPTQKRSVDQILKAGWYLLELINEILDLAVIESGKMTLSMEVIGLREVFQECEAIIESQAKKRDICLAFVKTTTPLYVRGDRTRIKQVLINLLSNAVKYNKVGGNVTVKCNVHAPEVIRITVTDTGAGLTDEQLAQLFQPFNRLGHKSNIEDGTGIGLVVSKRLVELMHGTIGVASVVGAGSAFWVDLKLCAAPATSVTNVDDKYFVAPPREGSKQVHTLLYVEDNPANLMLVEDIIARRPDICLISARDGMQGIALAHSLQPDAILMDINLPGLSGIEALKILADGPTTTHIPVIALSANAIPRDIQRGLQAGFFRYLTKPIKVVEFIETLDIALALATKRKGTTS